MPASLGNSAISLTLLDRRRLRAGATNAAIGVVGAVVEAEEAVPGVVVQEAALRVVGAVGLTDAEHEHARVQAP